MADKGGNFELPTYDFGHKYRGCAIVIVNKDFQKNGVPEKKLKRHGSTVDLKNMNKLFEALDFKVKSYKNLTAEKMKEKILKASTNEEFNQNSDCFALVISSHGEEVEEKKVQGKPDNAQVWRHRVLGSDCNPVYIDDTIDYFKDEDLAKGIAGAKGLAGKPKLFFIQACRSSLRGKNRYDYGVDVNVIVPVDHSGIQPTDAVDHVDKSVLDEFTNFEDVNRDLTDYDEDEWKGDDEADTSDDDDESLIDSDKDLSDAKGEPDSGYMPPSPEMDLPRPRLPAKDDKVVSPHIGEPQVGGSGDVSVPSETPQDMEDANPGVDSDALPPSPFDIIPIKCPNNCLLVYPVTSGAVSFRRLKVGSCLLHYMHKNLHNLLKGSNLLQYLTQVCGDMAREVFKKQTVKVSTIVSHRLTKQVVFEPKSKKSIMAAEQKKMKKMFL